MSIFGNQADKFAKFISCLTCAVLNKSIGCVLSKQSIMKLGLSQFDTFDLFGGEKEVEENSTALLIGS